MKTKLRTRIISIILALVTVLGVLAVPISATMSGTDMRRGIDYSGQGTVIDGEINDEESSYVDGDYLMVPIWHGKYEAKWYDYWWRHSFSDWSPNNHRKNSSDFSVYNGSDTATEFDVESRTEYKYGRYEKTDAYAWLYKTYYIGTEWWNKGRKTDDTSWNGYPGKKYGYRIIGYSRSWEKHGKTYKYVESDWETDTPFSWWWEDDWTQIDTRTSYRYRSRTLYWNEHSYTEYEKCPLNYSLYNTDGTPISNGIYWEYDASVTGKYGKVETLFENTEEYGGVYYITDAEVVKYLVDVVEEYEDNEGTGFIGAFLSMVDGITGGIIFSDWKVGAALAVLTYICSLHDEIMSDLKARKINSFQELLKKVEREEYVLVVTDYTSATYDGMECDTDSKVSLSYREDMSAVSASARANGYGTEFGYASDSFGTISYGIDEEEVFNKIAEYLTINYPMFFLWNY